MSEIRILEVEDDERQLSIPGELRSVEVDGEESRTFYPPAESRKLEVLLP